MNDKPASESPEGVTSKDIGSSALLGRFSVENRCPLCGWNTWVIYDEERHAIAECQRRIDEAPLRDKANWRVARCA